MTISSKKINELIQYLNVAISKDFDSILSKEKISVFVTAKNRFVITYNDKNIFEAYIGENDIAVNTTIHLRLQHLIHSPKQLEPLIKDSLKINQIITTNPIIKAKDDFNELEYLRDVIVVAYNSLIKEYPDLLLHLGDLTFYFPSMHYVSITIFPTYNHDDLNIKYDGRTHYQFTGTPESMSKAIKKGVLNDIVSRFKVTSSFIDSSNPSYPTLFQLKKEFNQDENSLNKLLKKLEGSTGELKPLDFLLLSTTSLDKQYTGSMTIFKSGTTYFAYNERNDSLYTSEDPQELNKRLKNLKGEF